METCVQVKEDSEKWIVCMKGQPMNSIAENKLQHKINVMRACDTDQSNVGKLNSGSKL